MAVATEVLGADHRTTLILVAKAARLTLAQTGNVEPLREAVGRIEAVLGNAGYTFASATGEPVVDEGGNTVTIRYFVDAGQRAYVRRVSFQGNTVTQDEVLRREMRQMEGGWASTAMIEASKIRLQRLGFFKEVNVETPSVPGTEDQIDVNFSVEEQPSGSISATVGFAEDTGLILGLQYQVTCGIPFQGLLHLFV